MAIDLLNLKTIVENIPNYVFWKDTQSYYLGCNLNFAHFVGLTSPHDIVGKTDSDLPWDKDVTDSHIEEDKEIIRTKKAILNKETRIVTREGYEHILLANKVPLFDEHGKIIGILGAYMDITSLKKTEQQLIHAKEKAEVANKMKTEFLENMRHDIRTPLTGIIGFAKLIQDEATEPKIKKHAENLAASSDILMDFLSEVLEMLQDVSGERPLLKQKFDLKEKLERIVKLNQTQAEENKLTLQLAYDERIPHYLIGDGKRISRIILELVTNALKFTHKGGVKISASLAKVEPETSNAVLKIAVSDTGIGIPKDKQRDIFIRFHRLTPTYQETYKGLGMGLSIVEQFIDDLGAEIYVDSELNKGATFTCIIPVKIALLDEALGVDHALLTQTKKSIPSIEQPEEQNKNKEMKHILLVEDHPLVAQAVKSMLDNLGCQSDIAKNGETALNYWQKNKYDLILMDVGLPDIDGCEITRQIRLEDEHIPIIALTAHVSTENKKRCFEMGMDAVFFKPLEKEDAQMILNRFIPKTKERDLLTLEGTVIDLELGAKRLNTSLAGAKKMIRDMLAGSVEDMNKLEEAYRAKNWGAVRDRLHRIRGALAYCGAPRVEIAFLRFHEYIKLHDGTNPKEESTAEKLYQQALQEWDLLKQAREIN